jgi:hypothetical protein
MPLLLLGFVHVIVTPLRDVFSIEPLLMIPYYLFGLLIGILIYRKSNTVRDYEYRRSKVMKQMKNVYAAEEAGVWQTNVEVPDKLSEQSNLSTEVSSISREAPELELSDDDKVEVSMLNESQKVIEATRRVSGQSTFDDMEVESTIGARRKSSPMDRFLDFVIGIFSNNSAIDTREQRRQVALKAASDAAPVRAEKPQAPIQYERNQVEIGPDSEYIDNFSQDQQASSNDAQSVRLGQAKSSSAFAPPIDNKSLDQTLESMAMLSANNPSFVSPQSPNKAPTCSSCGYPIKPDDRYCDNCGMGLATNP